MKVFVSVIQGRFMFCISTNIHKTLFLSFLIGAALVVSACQPVSQSREGRLVKVPVIFPKQNIEEPAERSDIAETALRQDELAAEPSSDNLALAPQQPASENDGLTDTPIVVVRPAGEPAQPRAAATFNPADLVGKPKSYLDSQFGQADFSRTEGIIHVLQYRQPDCVIDLFIAVTDTAQTIPSAQAEIVDWAMRERIVNQPLDLKLCKQQFYERKL